MENFAQPNKNFRGVYPTSSPVIWFGRFSTTRALLRAEEKQNNSPISSGIQLILVTTYYYFCVYQYERGACGEYGISEYLIHLDLTTNLNFGFKVFALFLIVYFVPYSLWLALYTVFNLRSVRRTAWLQINSSLISLCLIWLLLGGARGSSWLTIGIFAAVVLISNFLPMIFVDRIVDLTTSTQRRNWSYKQPTGRTNKISDLVFVDPMGLILLFNGVSRSGAGIVAGAFIVLLSSFSMGKQDALSQINYDVSVDHPGFIVLRRYGDEVLMRDYNEKTHTLGNKLVIDKQTTQCYTTTFLGHLKSPVIK